MIPRANLADLYPLSPMQEGLLFQANLSDDRSLYCVQVEARLSGLETPEPMARAWSTLAKRHEILRSVFVQRLTRPFQAVLRETSPIIAELPRLALDTDAGWADWLAHDQSRGFELDTREPPWRVHLGIDAADQLRLVFTFHHILLDGWSAGLLFSEMMRWIEAECRGTTADLGIVQPYSRFISWLEDREQQPARDYWRDYLTGYTESSRLPSPMRREAAGELGEVGFELSSADGRRLEELAARVGTSPSTCLEAAWGILLGRSLRRRDVVFGSVASGRPPELQGIDNMVGLFITTLPRRVRWSPADSTESLIRRLHRESVDRQPFQTLGLAEIQRGHPPVEPIFAFEGFPIDEGLRRAAGAAGSGVAVESVRVTERSHYDLELVIQPADRTRVALRFDRSRYLDGLMQEAATAYGTLLRGLLDSPETSPDRIPWLTPADRSRVVVEWNRPTDHASPEPEPTLLSELLQHHATTRPDAVAVTDVEGSLSYGALDRRANQLARELIHRGIGREDRVGLATKKGRRLLLGICAIWKAGGCYVPLDPSLPAERLTALAKDAGVALILTEETSVEGLAGLDMPVLTLDTDRDWMKRPQTAPRVRLAPGNLAYMIYTSGSTGRPKGALLTHEPLANLALHTAESSGLRPGDRVLLLASISFDASVWEVARTLASGATLHFVDDETARPGAELAASLRERRITSLFLTPSALEVLPRPLPRSLHTVHTGGEACPSHLAEGWPEETRLVNFYGPTETTVCVSSDECRPGQPFEPPIGKPLRRCRIYLVDELGEPVAPGMAGEMWIGGLAVGRGYHRRPGLTADRFVPDELGDEPGQRLYRTGDLGRHLDDGRIVFAGRLDEQLKVRGFRVEPGEIETALLADASVAQAAVTRGDGDRLVAYLVPTNADSPDFSELRLRLRQKLPAYMVPSEFLTLSELPTMASGKIDRHALPAPDSAARSAPFVAPRTETERNLVDIWQDVLQRRPVSIEDDFFDLGGHSLLATRLVSRISSELDASLPLRELFENPRIALLADVLDQRAATVAEGHLPRAERSHHLPLSFAQERMWTLEQLQGSGRAYNVTLAVRLEGSVSWQALEQSLAEIVRRHESLRTTFAIHDGAPAQTILRHQAFSLTRIDLSSLAAADREVAAEDVITDTSAHGFDLERGPLLRTVLARFDTNDHLLVLVMHHIASDGWSTGVLTREIAALHEAMARGEPSPLPDLSAQYVDYAAWQRRRFERGEAESHLAYWRRQLEGAPQLTQLPLDRPRPAIQSTRGARHCFRLDAELTAALHRVARAHQASLYMTLVAGFAALLGRYSGDRDIVLGSLIANRGHRDTEAMIGFFVNTLALRIDLHGNPDFAALVRRVRTTTVDAYSHQELPFERVVEEISPTRVASHFPLVQAIVVLHNQPFDEVEMERVRLTPVAAAAEVPVRFDLELYFQERDDGLEGELLFNRDLFDAATAARLCRHLEILLRAATDAPERALSTLSLLSPSERHRLEAQRQATHRPRAAETVVDLFRQRAVENPDRLVLRGRDHQLSFRETARWADAVSHQLAEAGVARCDVVAVLLPRSVSAVVAILGVLEAGAAYVPIDPGDPDARITTLLAESGASAVVTTRNQLARISDLEWHGHVVEIDPRTIPDSRRRPATPRRNIVPGELAYVLYTSGSTGRPKGVMVTHGGLMNYLFWARSAYSIDAETSFALCSSLSFDLTVTSLFLPLITGGTLEVYERRSTSADLEVLTVVEDDRVDVLKVTPSHLRLLAQASPGRRLSRLIVGGEQFPTDLAREVTAALPVGAAIFNEYGPTECVVGCALHRFDSESDQRAAVAIGGPIDNTTLCVVDGRLEPVPDGVTGELLIAGAGVARGYLGHPRLTAERFLPDPLATGERRYLSGDRALLRPDGQLEFRGRIDRELKIQGFRVDPAEIEQALGEVEGVEQCVVTLRGAAVDDEVLRCARCGLSSEHPMATFEDDGVCTICHEYERHRHRAAEYFRPFEELEALFEQRATAPRHDCIMLYSGGKDSTYALYQLVAELGLNVLVFTLDNGFLSEQTLANIRRVTDHLGVEHHVATTPHMDEIFRDSLQRFSNVCNGCFKTIYTLGMRLARERGIRYIVTGLSRGQIFETRLAELHRVGVWEPAEIDQTVHDARKAYHREADACAEHLAGDLFADDSIFDEVRFVDFYRYSEAELGEMIRYLAEHAPWIRPSDTGRSTNCLINDVGISVHKRERGFHNYALPYSWDVRLGHKTWSEAVDELDDDIDAARVEDILVQIGYRPTNRRQQELVAYYSGSPERAKPKTASSGSGFGLDQLYLRTQLADVLPSHMVPERLVYLDDIPLNSRGKIDLASLPEPGKPARRRVEGPPNSATERKVARVWTEVLGIDQLDVGDDFFELGGHSLMATQVISRLRDVFSLLLPMQLIVENPTVRSLGAVIDDLESVASQPPQPSGDEILEEGVL
ncbi:MAG: amino acid adenylation domain-containing protein [Thermoanaerobaculia bacterium]|nr:amino acid adenylation domain-containing protein [Thermoanaerobaculia bacterium]